MPKSKIVEADRDLPPFARSLSRGTASASCVSATGPAFFCSRRRAPRRRPVSGRHPAASMRPARSPICLPPRRPWITAKARRSRVCRQARCVVPRRYARSTKQTQPLRHFHLRPIIRARLVGSRGCVRHSQFFFPTDNATKSLTVPTDHGALFLSDMFPRPCARRPCLDRATRLCRG